MGIIIRQSIKGTLVNYVGAFIGFLSTLVVATRFLSEKEIGLIQVLLEAATLLATLAQLGTNSSAIRFFPYFKDEANRHNGFFFYLMIVPFIGFSLFVPLFFLFKPAIIAYFTENSPLFVEYADWIIPLMLFVLYISVFETYSNVLMRVVVPKFIREVVIRLMLVSIYLLYGLGVLSLTGLVVAFVVAYGIAMVLNLWYSLKIGKPTLRRPPSYITPPLRNSILRYSGYVLLGALGGSITSKLDLFMVSGELGLDWGGIFRIAFYMAAIIDIPSRSMTAISTPIASQYMRDGNLQEANALYRKVALHQLLAGGFIFLFLWINLDAIFAIMPKGAVYAEGKWVVFFIGLSRLVFVFLGFGQVLINYSRYYYWTLFFTFLITGVTIVTNLWLIPRLGITGAALATLITVVLTHLVQQWLVFAKLKGNPYSWDAAKLIALLLLLFGINTLLPVWQNPWIDALLRSALIGLPGLVGVYALRISPEVNRLAGEILSWLKRG